MGDVICLSKKHWSVYIFPSFLLFIGFLYFLSSFAGIRQDVFRLIFSVVICLLSLNRILDSKKTEWILTKDVLIIKSGFLPWRRSYFEIPIEDVYEAYYEFGFWAKIFGYGHLIVRRTEGDTSVFRTAKMTNCDNMTQRINAEVRDLKRQQMNRGGESNVNKSHFVADELSKLNDLLLKGVISKDEFLDQKKKILRG